MTRREEYELDLPLHAARGLAERHRPGRSCSIAVAVAIDDALWAGSRRRHAHRRRPASCRSRRWRSVLLGAYLAKTTLSTLADQPDRHRSPAPLRCSSSSVSVHLAARPTLEGRLHDLNLSVSIFVHDVFVLGTRSTETSIFLLVMGALVWGAGLFCAFAVFRRHRPLPAIVLPGSILLLNVIAHDARAVPAPARLRRRGAVAGRAPQPASSRRASGACAACATWPTSRRRSCATARSSSRVAVIASIVPRRQCQLGAAGARVERLGRRPARDSATRSTAGWAASPARRAARTCCSRPARRSATSGSRRPKRSSRATRQRRRRPALARRDVRLIRRPHVAAARSPGAADRRRRRIPRPARLRQSRAPAAHEVTVEVLPIDYGGDVFVAPAQPLDRRPADRADDARRRRRVRVGQADLRHRGRACPTRCARWSAHDGRGVLTASRLAAAGTDYPDWVKPYLDIRPDSIGDIVHQHGARSSRALPKATNAIRTTSRWRSRTTCMPRAASATTTDIRGECAGEKLVDCFMRIKKGYCEYFATAMVMMLRAHGHPGALRARLSARPAAGRRHVARRPQRRARLGRGLLPRLRLGRVRSQHRATRRTARRRPDLPVGGPRPAAHRSGDPVPAGPGQPRRVPRATTICVDATSDAGRHRRPSAPPADGGPLLPLLLVALAVLAARRAGGVGCAGGAYHRPSRSLPTAASPAWRRAWAMGRGRRRRPTSTRRGWVSWCPSRGPISSCWPRPRSRPSTAGASQARCC